MVTLFGTSWSVACWDIRRLLEGMQVAYQFVDLDTDDEAMVWVVTLSEGRDVATMLPILRMDDNTVLLAATRQSVASHFGVRLDSGLLRRVARDNEEFSVE
jgi:hypothetical protein